MNYARNYVKERFLANNYECRFTGLALRITGLYQLNLSRIGFH